MKIEVEKTIGKVYVQINCKYGHFIGKWMEENIPLNGTFEVEIDYDKILSYKILDEEYYYIGNINGKNIISGFIIDEGNDDDFIQYLDFGGDGIINIELIGNNISKDYIKGDGIIMINIKENKLKNKFIELELDNMEIYPVYY
jgi:hypothetical protein